MAGVFGKITKQVGRPPVLLLCVIGILSGITCCDAEPDIAARRANGGGTGGASEPPPLGLGGAVGIPTPLALTGELQAHDPEVVVTDGGYELFFTGNLIQTKTSVDLLDWRATGEVFSTLPAWVPATLEGVSDLWAPDVSFFGGKFHLYFAASTFGTGVSCIGHASSVALGEEATWQDEGIVICSDVEEIVDWDAIDPSTFADEAGNWWMVFGSYSSGIKMISLARDGTRSGVEIHALAARTEEAIQAPALFFHDGYYYFFASFDQCCAGVSSTSTIRVGRSTEVTGPYLDKEGTPLLEGGGSLFISGNERFRAVGGSSFFSAGGQWFSAYHGYDASSAGQATLRIAPVVFDEESWPLEHEP